MSSTNQNRNLHFNDIYKELYTPILNFINAIINDQYIAEEITSWLFVGLTVKVNLNQFDTMAKVKAYLYISAKYRSIDYLKCKKSGTS